MNASRREAEPGQLPTYVPLGRGLAIGGLGLVVPVALCLMVLMAGMQMAAEACYLNGCERRLMKAFSWCWPVMGASAATGIVAALLPDRLAKPRFVLATLQLVLTVAPFVILAGAAPA